MFYVGNDFESAKARPYKTRDGAIKAAERDGLKAFDEDGNQGYPVIVEAVNEVPDGALEPNADGSVNAYDADGNLIGTVTPEDVAAAEANITEDDINAAIARADDAAAAPAAKKVTKPISGKIRRAFDGKIRLRRAPSWEPSAVCGASKFTTKRVVGACDVDGKTMFLTEDGFFITGDPDLVVFTPDDVSAAKTDGTI